MIEEEIFFLGISLLEIIKVVLWYIDVEFFKDFEYLFILIEGFWISREVSFEEKNRLRNFVIIVIFLYCGLKIYEVVEFKCKDVFLIK